MLKTIIVAGARPNFMKVAPLVAAMTRRAAEFQSILVHTGQHYDASMSDAFFRDLQMPRADVHLGVGSASHAVQTAQVMQAFEPIVISEKPDWVVVVGDVNSTLACALVCAKLGVKVAHVEAGWRSRERSMPEEISGRFERITNIPFIDPLGYLDFLGLLSNARLVLTDSGGIQEETTVLGIPCITLRENTERPITIEMGTNTIVGTDPEKIVAAAFCALDNPPLISAHVPPLWDGKTADRILDALAEVRGVN